MPENRKIISPGNTPRKSYLPWLVLSGLIVLSVIMFLALPPSRKSMAPVPSSDKPTPPPSGERFMNPYSSSEPKAARARAPRVEVNPDRTVSVVEEDPALVKLGIALQAGRCEELNRLVGPSAQDQGTRQFYASFIYSSGVDYFEKKEYRKAANFMRCFLDNYQEYRDEAILVLIHSDIALGDKTEARQYLQKFKIDFPFRKEEITEIERDLALGN
ncbi:MAG: hypothetical protein PHE84_11185 [bacterium]|nr:hypothetical protein [bacterium]